VPNTVTDRAEGGLMTLLLAICCAAIAACCFAGAATLQHGAVRVCSAGGSLGLRAIRQMIRSRHWQAGTGLAVTGSGLHVTALSQAPLVIVQPIGVLSLVLTVLLGTRASGRAAGPGVRAAVTCVCAGTGGFVALAAIAGTTTAEAVQPGPVAIVVAGALVLTGTALATRGRVRCLMLGASAAVLFGAGSALIRTASLEIGHSSISGIGLGALAAVLMVGGGLAQHQAYASGPPAVVVAATTVVDPLTAVVISIAVYGEAARVSPAGMVVQLALAALAGAAVIVLARAIPTARPAHPEPIKPPLVPV
jgi:hypothetical protein